MPVSDLMNDGDLVRELQALKRQVAELMGGRRLESASVGAGGIRLAAGGGITLDGGDITIRDGALRLLDSADREVIRIGRALDGSYDLIAIDPDSGRAVKLAALAFGRYRESTQVTGERDSFDLGPLTPDNGPVVTGVRVGSPGRMDITIGAFMQYSPGQGGQMSVQLKRQGDNTITDPDITRQRPQLSFGTGEPGGLVTQWAQGTATATMSGLEPGIYTVTPVYAAIGTAPPQCFFADRFVECQGYY